MKKLYGFVGFLAIITMAAGASAQTSMTAVNGAAVTSQSGGSAAAGVGIAQPGIIVRPLPVPFPQPEPGTNDIIQFNNLQIQSISSTNLPSEILAVNSYDYYPAPVPMMSGSSGLAPAQTETAPTSASAAKCFTFDSINSAAAKSITCPTPNAAAPSTAPSTPSIPTTAPNVQVPNSATQTTATPGAMTSSASPPSTSPQTGTATPKVAPTEGMIAPMPPILSRAYRIEIDASTRLRLRDQSSATLADLAAGDQINIFGIYNSDGTIQALILRDLSKPVEKTFIQLNNVTVLSVSGSVAPATIVVAQQPVNPCFNYGANGTGAAMRYPCPMGLQSFSDNPASANMKLPPSMAPNFIIAQRKYIVNVDGQTILMNRTKSNMGLPDIKAGDQLNVYGSTNGNGETIDADIVRDLTQPSTVTSLGGTVTQVNGDGSFILQTSDGQTLTVQNPIQVGATVKLTGLIDELRGLVSQLSQLIVQNNSQNQPPVLAPLPIPMNSGSSQ